MDIIEQLVLFVGWYADRMQLPLQQAIHVLHAIYDSRKDALLPLVEQFKQEQQGSSHAD
ncbi:MAG: hypothetical protein KDB03_02495 [Planctomycetales bacterium]|nr:hypothetical protein [Planctomycetales bacterium]